MKEYVLTSISNRLLRNKRNDEVDEMLRDFEDFHFSEEGLEEFLSWISGLLDSLCTEYPRMKPLSYRRLQYGGDLGTIWVSIMPEKAYTENQLTLAFTVIKGHWEMPKSEEK